MLNQRFWNKVDIRGLNDCWEWQGAKQGSGYGYYFLERTMPGVKEKPHLAHRYLMDQIHGGIAGWLVLHKCGNKLCVNPLHLRLGTHQDNMDDAKRMSEMALGEKNARSKLNAQDIIDIRASQLDNKLLAKKYNISYQHLMGIKRRKFWKHIS